MKFSREWAMPSPNTFSIPPIRRFVQRWLDGRTHIVDPFARDSRYATVTNDISTKTSATFHMRATDFLEKMVNDGERFDAILFDPPYSPRQISECYQSEGLKVTQTDTQLSAMTKVCRSRFSELASDGCVCLTFGWQSVSIGEGWNMEEILLVPHGGAHNDTICTAQVYRPQPRLDLTSK